MAQSTPITARASRFDLNIALTFETDDGVKNGHCVNVSHTGMMAMFDTPIDLFTAGRIYLLAGEFYVSIKARVARIHGSDAGLAFLLENDNDQKAAGILVALATASLQPAREEGTP